jgi:nitrite reductase/ring-hydroxylating ferredoxin subunit
MASSPDDSRQSRDFGTVLLSGLVLLILVVTGLIVALYAVPPEHLIISEHEASVRIERVEDFPLGASRVQTWGDHVVLIVRSGERSYNALEGVSPADGCLLRWDAESMRVVSPCAHQVYDLLGRPVEGLTTEPLRRYAVFVREGVVYVTRG